jgi:ABC-type nitrate/sulfonate/bicarbonate transport system substrate-binding protein
MRAIHRATKAAREGKKIAATPGTGPYIGLITALAKAGLKKKEDV